MFFQTQYWHSVSLFSMSKVLYTRLPFIKNTHLELYLLKLICPDTSKTKEIDYTQCTDARLNLQYQPFKCKRNQDSLYSNQHLKKAGFLNRPVSDEPFYLLCDGPWCNPFRVSQVPANLAQDAWSSSPTGISQWIYGTGNYWGTAECFQGSLESLFYHQH